MRPQGLRQHIGTVGMGPPIILRPGLPFGIGLHKETAEIRDERIDFIGLGLPPGEHRRIQRVSGLEPAETHRGCPFDREINPDTVLPEDVGYPGHPLYMLSVKNKRIGVDIIEHRAVDPDRRAETAVTADTLRGYLRRCPLPHGEPRVAALHGVVEIVPVIEDTEPIVWLFSHLHTGPRLPEHLRPLEGIGSVHYRGGRAAVYVADAVPVIDVELFPFEGAVYPGTDRTENLIVAAGVGHP